MAGEKAASEQAEWEAEQTAAGVHEGVATSLQGWGVEEAELIPCVCFLQAEVPA